MDRGERICLFADSQTDKNLSDEDAFITFCTYLEGWTFCGTGYGVDTTRGRSVEKRSEDPFQEEESGVKSWVQCSPRKCVGENVEIPISMGA